VIGRGVIEVIVVLPAGLLVVLLELRQHKALPVTGREGSYGCETSRLPHFLDNRLTDGGEVVSPTRQLPFTPRKIPGSRFC
jgi:hypothetical protein